MDAGRKANSVAKVAIVLMLLLVAGGVYFGGCRHTPVSISAMMDMDKSDLQLELMSWGTDELKKLLDDVANLHRSLADPKRRGDARYLHHMIRVTLKTRSVETGELPDQE